MESGRARGGRGASWAVRLLSRLAYFFRAFFLVQNFLGGQGMGWVRAGDVVSDEELFANRL
jgi:hypothetical protein